MQYTHEEICEKLKSQNKQLLELYKGKTTLKHKILCQCGNTYDAPLMGVLNRKTCCGCKRGTDKIKYKIGDTINGYKILGIERIGKNKTSNYKTECLTCKSIVYRNTTDIANSNKLRNSCTKCYKEQNNRRWSGYEGITGTFWSSLQGAAKCRSLSVDITKEYIWSCFLKQNKRCFFTDLDLIIKSNPYREWNASLDRIDSNIGYIEGNVQWVDKNINLMKKTLNNEEFIYWCNLITNPVVKNIISESCTIIYDRSNFYGRKSLGCGNLDGEYLFYLTRNAKNRKIGFHITQEEIWRQFLKQEGRCAITNVPLKLHFDPKLRNASLDRIDSKKPYTTDNIQWVHQIVNGMKWNYSEEYFIDLCRKVTIKNPI